MFKTLYWYWLTTRVIDEFGDVKVETIYLILPKHVHLKEVYEGLREREIAKNYKSDSTAILFMQRMEKA